MSNIAVEVEGLVKTYPRVNAVSGISFHVNEGEVFGLLGPNGAGKTTTIRMLLTLVKPTAGNIWILGINALSDPAKVRNLAGYVPQDVSVDGELTAWENMLMYAKLSDVPRHSREKLIKEAIEYMAQSVMFVAIFYGIQVVWERDLGLLNKLLSTPTPRSAIVMGKALSAGLRGIVQALAVFILALIIQVHIDLNPLNLLGILVIIILLGMFFSSLSMCLVALVRTRERVMGIGQALTMPLFFASNAIYPTSILLGWLKALVTVNPLSYVIDSMRGLLVTGDTSRLGLDFAVIIFATVVMVLLASLSFRRIIS